MKCPECGSYNKDSAKFCNECGKKLSNDVNSDKDILRNGINSKVLEKNCVNHPEATVVSLCNKCGESFCARCLYDISTGKTNSGLYVCSKCFGDYRQRMTLVTLGSIVILPFAIVGLMIWNYAFSMAALLFFSGLAIFGIAERGHVPFTLYDYIRLKEESAKAKTGRETQLYNELQRFYAISSTASRQLLETRIEDLTKKGLSRTEAIKHLAIKEKIIEEE